VTKTTNSVLPATGKHASPKSHSSNPGKPPHAVTFETFRHFFETRPPEVVANIIICLIHQTNYLLDQQLRRLEKDFVERGGLRENMTRARLEHRAKQQRGEA
jgi:four helix bundle suffix protein